MAWSGQTQGIPVNDGRDLMKFNQWGGTYMVPNPDYAKQTSTAMPSSGATLNTGQANTVNGVTQQTGPIPSATSGFAPSVPAPPSPGVGDAGGQTPPPTPPPPSMDALNKVAMPAVDDSSSMSLAGMSGGGSGGGGMATGATGSGGNMLAGMLRPMARRSPPMDTMALAGLGRKVY